MSESVATPAPRRRWLMPVLIASLALNALVIGMVARSVWHTRAAINVAGGLDGNLPAFVNQLPSERRDALQQQIGPNRPWLALRPLRADIRRARQDVAQAFVADPFDRERFAAAQARLVDAEIALRRSMQQMIPAVAERMTADERRQFLRWRGGGRGGPRGGGPDGDGAEERGFGKRR